MQKISCGSFFAGVGGIDIGFEATNYFEVNYANEFDKHAIETYEHNFNIKVDNRDIHNVKGDEIPNFDVMLGGFPCQGFSIAGYRQGFNDEKGRGTLFFEIVRIIREKKLSGHQPKILFLENVKNLVSHDNGNTFNVIIEYLNELGYHVKFRVLNGCSYGNIPQNRERIYIVGFLDKDTYKNFEFPMPIPLTKTIKNIINFETKIDEKYYYTKGKYKGDIYEKLVEAMDDENSVYQWRRKYVRKNQSNLIPCLTANQGEGGHNVCLIKTKHGIRKMTPHECFNAQGFPDGYKLPKKLSDSRLYKQAGNSVVVSVIQQIAQSIKDALLNTK